MSKEAATMEKRSASEIPARELTRSRRTYSPAVDIVETREELVLHADMPGVGSDNLEVHFENGELTIYGKVHERQPDDQEYLVREYGTGDFYRVFAISEAIDAEKISAEFRDGVLTLHLPKVEAAKSRKIQVRGK